MAANQIIGQFARFPGRVFRAPRELKQGAEEEWHASHNRRCWRGIESRGSYQVRKG